MAILPANDGASRWHHVHKRICPARSASWFTLIYSSTQWNVFIMKWAHYELNSVAKQIFGAAEFGKVPNLRAIVISGIKIKRTKEMQPEIHLEYPQILDQFLQCLYVFYIFWCLFSADPLPHLPTSLFVAFLWVPRRPVPTAIPLDDRGMNETASDLAKIKPHEPPKHMGTGTSSKPHKYQTHRGWTSPI